MKKTLLGLSAAALLLSFASCKKDWTCTCDYTVGGRDTAIAIPYSDVTRQDAHDACDATETTYKSNSAFSSVDCEVGD